VCYNFYGSIFIRLAVVAP